MKLQCYNPMYFSPESFLIDDVTLQLVLISLFVFLQMLIQIIPFLLLKIISDKYSIITTLAVLKTIYSTIITQTVA